MNRQSRERREDYDGSRGWDEQPRRREYANEDFESSHDRREVPSRWTEGGEHQRGYERRASEFSDGSSGSQRAGRFARERNRPGEPDYYGYRPEPRFEDQYRESYRAQDERYRRQYGQNSSRPREQEHREGPRWEDAPRETSRFDERRAPRSYRERSQEHSGYADERGYPEQRRWEHAEDHSRYGSYESARESGRGEMRGGYGPQPQYGYDERERREPQGGYREPERYSEERDRGYRLPRGTDERGEYEEWLQEHQGRDRGTEGERQLEGLREQHLHHHSDERYEEELGSRQPRSQRRYERYDEPEGRPRSGEMRPTARTAPNPSRPRSAGRSTRTR